MKVLHKVVGLPLCDVFVVQVEFPSEEYEQLKRVNQPDQRHKACVHKKEYRFLLDHPIKMCVVVPKADCLYGQSHQSRCKEHSQGVLKGKRSLQFVRGVRFLQFGKVVQEVAHHKFVEQDYDQNQEIY